MTCKKNTTAKEIEEALIPYYFQYDKVAYQLKNCVILPEILRRANITYSGTIRFEDALPVPARFLHNSVGLQRLYFRLYVNCNAVDILPAQLFHNQSALETLELELFCEPYEVTLPSQIFHTLYGLNKLVVGAHRRNQGLLRNLTAAHFRDTSNFRKLDLLGNYMQTLSSELFVTLTELNELNLSWNGLAALPSGLLRAQGKLIILDLSFNHLHALPPGIFNTTPLLWKLDLSGNQFSVPTNIIAAVQPLRFLYRLILSYNKFTHIAGAGEFENYTLLSRQHIREIDATPPYFQDYLEQLSSIWYWEKCSRTLIDLSYNRIESFHLRDINADHNPLQCDCTISLIDCTNILMETDEMCNLHNHSYLIRNRAICPWMPKFCPTGCNCHYDTRTLYINCSHAHLEGLTELPRPEQVYLTQSRLDITHNNFYMLPSNATFGYANVTRLYAAHNRLENIQSAHLPPQLEVLDVRNNSLERLSDGFIQYFLNESATLRQLYLSENPWLCDCDAKQLLNAVRTHRKRIPDVTLLVCANLENTSLQEARYEDVCVPESMHLAWLLFSISLEKTFDAFISYAHQDARFVNDILLPGLEQGEPQFSVCTHERNWLAGAYIPEQIIESVDQSRRTIIVLSQHFIESDWARMEFRTAHQCALNERRSRIIIVKYGELKDVTKLDKELRAYLTMNTYLEWVDHPWFWMPHCKGEVRSAGMLELNERRRAYVIGDVERNTLGELEE
ncbi:protein toll-like [Zeugodacus cucurbitae]|uniref:protein toll-like n=1 Tax=Zeugodacus cucurbitae TaxID=28588 RepID=UPI0023D90BB9|nr:protein toll-like [Zeugodacus cucurbitae]